MKRRALITGSKGFIGGHLKSKLHKLGWEVFSWDLIDSKDVREVAGFDMKVDCVFHLAGISGQNYFKNNLIEGYDINLTGTLAVLNYSQKMNARCIFASTSGVYQSNDEKVDESSTLDPQTPYAISKLLGENLCYQFSKDWDTSITVLRIFNVYGREQVETFLIPYIVKKFINGETLEIRMPEAARDFILLLL